jgi:hypothetical protein
VTGLIAAAALSLILDAMAPAGIDWVSIVLFGTAMGALYCKVNVFYILIMCGLARTFLFFLGM